MDNMSFIDLYNIEKRKLTPAQEFIKNMAKLTKRSESTVRQWVVGMFTPDELCKSIISEKLGIDADILFPPKKK